MQLGAAEAGDLAKETAATQRDYGLEDVNQLKARFGKNCLLRGGCLMRGVRFVQLFNGSYAMGERCRQLGWSQNAEDTVRRPSPDSRSTGNAAAGSTSARYV